MRGAASATGGTAGGHAPGRTLAAVLLAVTLAGTVAGQEEPFTPPPPSGRPGGGATGTPVDELPPPDYGEIGTPDEYADPEEGDPHVQVGMLDGYFGFKERLAERSDFTYLVEYAPILQWGAGAFHADHELNVIPRWAPVDSPSLGQGQLMAWYQQSVTLGGLTTGEFQETLGVLSPVNGGDTSPDNAAHRLQLLAWEQVSPGGRLRLMVGKLTTRVLFNLNRYAVSDREDFLTPMIVNNPVVLYTARGGLGLYAQYRSDLVSVSGMIRDADAQSDFIDFGSLGSGIWEQMGEVALSPTRGESEGRYRLTWHHTDAVGEGDARIPSGWSLSFSADQDIGSRLGAFARFAWTDTPVRAFRQRLAAGLQLRGVLGWEDDRIGLGFWWGDPTDPALRDEKGLELFWRLQIGRALELTPDLMLVFDPALQPERGVRPVFGLRLRLVL